MMSYRRNSASARFAARGDERAAPFRSARVERVTLPKLEDGCAALLRLLPVEATVRPDDHVRRDARTALLPEELVHGALRAADVERPEHVKDALAATHRRSRI